MSQINVSNIDASYPVAGQDNDSTGFRTNFFNIKQNLDYAGQEISELQSKAILKGNITSNVGTTINDMTGAPVLSNALVQGFREVVKSYAQSTGSITLDFAQATTHVITTQGSIVIAFDKWPATGYAKQRLIVNIGAATHSVTLSTPTNGFLGLNSIAGVTASGTSYTISFTSAGTYVFDFSSHTGGSTVIVEDVLRSRNTVQGSLTINGNVTSTSSFIGNSATINGSLVVASSAPLSANASGATGQIAWDSGHVYVCVATNTWKRANLSTW